MLFHVTHTHNWESCPYHDPEKARDTFGKTMAGLGSTAATVVGAWIDAAAHKLIFVIDADSLEEIENLLAPIIDLGCAETRPVNDAMEVIRRRTAEA
jgi:hypothetical protein